MAPKVIALEKRQGPHHMMFQRLMRMVPDRDKSDQKLQRLIAFRLRLDGEDATSIYLLKQIRQMIQCAYRGSFYDFIKDDLKMRECTAEPGSSLDSPPKTPGAA